MERDRMFTDRMIEQTSRLGLPAIQLEVGGLTQHELLDQVALMFGL